MGDYLGGADYGEPGAEDELGLTRHIARPNPASPFPPVTLRGVGQPSSSSANTSPAPVDKEKTQPNAGTNDAAGISPRIARPSSSPPMGPLSLRRQADEAKLAAAEKSGSGISRLPGPARIPLRILETLGSVVSPASMAMIPGTSLHHSAELGSMRRNIGQDVAEEEKQAAAQKDVSQAQSLDRNDKLTQALASKGYALSFDANGEPQLAEIPGFNPNAGKPAEEQAFAAAVKKYIAAGKSPEEAAIAAFTEIKQAAQDVKPETHPPLGDAAAEQYNASILRELNVNPKTAQKQIPPEYKVLPTDTDAQAKEKMQRAKDLVAGATGQQHITVQTGEKNTARSDKSYQLQSSRLDKIRQPITQLNQRMGRLVDTLNQQSPQADALVAPELLSVMSGGQGSGLRMNEAEISRIVGSRSAWENLKASIQHWSTNPEEARSITADQDKQIRALVGVVKAKLDKKHELLDRAEDDLLASDDPKQQRRIVAEAQKAIDAIDAGTEGGGGTLTFKDGNDLYDVPPDKVDAFKAKHPKAQQQ